MVSAQPPERSEIRFLPLGDSYTIGEGVQIEERWPNQVTRALREKGVPIRLVDNPARTGWTTEDVIEHQLELVGTQRISLTTILVGVNDWVQHRSAEEFEHSLRALVEGARARLSAEKRLLLITIPDFGVTPTGARFSGGRNISEGIAEFNGIIKAAGKDFGIPVVDIYELSRQAETRPELTGRDGLHPSAQQYSEWAALITPAIEKLLASPPHDFDEAAKKDDSDRK
ncbi:MAG: SGNH/GDSL hydrolase family protein [Bdellovibrionota bacterium]